MILQFAEGEKGSIYDLEHSTCCEHINKYSISTITGVLVDWGWGQRHRKGESSGHCPGVPAHSP